MLTSDVSKRVVPIAAGITFGCDPEMFFSKGGKIIESGEILPEKGMDSNGQDAGKGYISEYTAKVVRDGVQAELNPPASGCRAAVVNATAKLIMSLKDKVQKNGAQISFDSVVTLNKEDLEKMSEAARVLGCLPSLNVHDAKATVNVGKDFQTRSAGGHIHLGYYGVKGQKAKQDRLAILMDILVGNTCVMIDRDPYAAERRKTYGRAGEYRAPNHGFEYRTLSNFWLRSSQLMSFVFGMSRLACHIHSQHDQPTAQASMLGLGSDPVSGKYTWDAVGTELNGWDPEKEILSRVNVADVAKAINTNDLELAKKNWAPIREFIDEHVPHMEAGLDTVKIPNFDYFLSEIEAKGIKRWFPLDPLEHWSTVSEGHGIGWEAWIEQCVDQVRAEEKIKALVEKYRSN